MVVGVEASGGDGGGTTGGSGGMAAAGLAVIDSEATGLSGNASSATEMDAGGVIGATTGLSDATVAGEVWMGGCMPSGFTNVSPGADGFESTTTGDAEGKTGPSACGFEAGAGGGRLAGLASGVTPETLGSGLFTA